MRALVAIGLVVVGVSPGASRADPAPQLSPGHGQREDAQLLREQLSVLDREPEPSQVTALAPRTAAELDAIRGHDAAVVRDGPLLRKWWFWAAIGAVAVTAIGVAIEADRGGDPGGGGSAPPIPGLTCDATGCR